MEIIKEKISCNGISDDISEFPNNISESYKNILESFSKFSEKLLKSTDLLLDVAKNRLESCQKTKSIF